MTPLHAVRLVAIREVRERVKSRAFRIGTVISAAVIVALVVFPHLNEKPKSYDLALVGTIDPVVRASVRNIDAIVGGDVRVYEMADADAARRQLRDGRLDIALVDGRSIIVDDPVDTSKISGRMRLVAAVSEAARLQVALTDAGLTSQQAANILRKPPLPVEALGKLAPAASDQATSFIGVIAIFIFFQTYGSWILVGVAEEKSSRIAEVLLAAVRPRALVAGKVFGIGLVGLGQAIVVAVSAIVASRVVGADVLQGTEAFDALIAVGWFLLGFGVYGWAYAAAGSLVARQSDAQAAAFPISIPLYVGYFASLTSVSGSEPSALVKVLGFLPPTAPMCMPTLIAQNAVAGWQIAVVVLATIVTAFFMARVAGAVYAASILRTGKRIKWLEALRTA